MKKHLFFTTLFIIRIVQIAYCQNLAINSTGSSGNPSAGLDVNFTDKGVLVSRINLISTTDVTTITAPANGLIVYNTNSSMTNGNGVGFYLYCAVGCTTAGWKYLFISENGPGTNGQILTSQGNGIAPKWETNTSEWTYSSKITFTNSSLQQNFSGLIPHDKWKLVFNLQNNGSTTADRLIVGVGINGITSSYQYCFHSNSGIASYTGVSNWTIYSTGADSDDSYIGETIITGKSSTPLNLKSFYSTGTGGLLSGNIAMNGRLAGDPSNLTSINIVPTNAISGTVELWYKDNQ